MRESHAFRVGRAWGPLGLRRVAGSRGASLLSDRSETALAPVPPRGGPLAAGCHFQQPGSESVLGLAPAPAGGGPPGAGPPLHSSGAGWARRPRPGPQHSLARKSVSSTGPPLMVEPFRASLASRARGDDFPLWRQSRRPLPPRQSSVQADHNPESPAWRRACGPEIRIGPEIRSGGGPVRPGNPCGCRAGAESERARGEPGVRVGRAGPRRAWLAMAGHRMVYVAGASEEPEPAPHLAVVEPAAAPGSTGPVEQAAGAVAGSGC